MIEIRTWYTYATDVLGYLNPKYKLVIGITRESTCEKLSEVSYFLICPKDTTRHKKDIFKSIYSSMYEKKKEIVLPDDHFLIKCYGKIIDSFIIKPETDSDWDFLKVLGPFTTWTIDHLTNYTIGKNIAQDGVKFGTLAIFILRVYQLDNYILYHRPVKQSVSNQYFNIEVDDDSIFDYKHPVVHDEEFNELFSSIKYIYSMYQALKTLK